MPPRRRSQTTVRPFFTTVAVGTAEAPADAGTVGTSAAWETCSSASPVPVGAAQPAKHASEVATMAPRTRERAEKNFMGGRAPGSGEKPQPDEVLVEPCTSSTFRDFF